MTQYSYIVSCSQDCCMANPFQIPIQYLYNSNNGFYFCLNFVRKVNNKWLFKQKIHFNVYFTYSLNMFWPAGSAVFKITVKNRYRGFWRIFMLKLTQWLFSLILTYLYDLFSSFVRKVSSPFRLMINDRLRVPVMKMLVCTRSCLTGATVFFKQGKQMKDKNFWFWDMQHFLYYYINVFLCPKIGT